MGHFTTKDIIFKDNVRLQFVRHENKNYKN